MRISMLVLGAAMLAGCSDPATQAPVTMMKGDYSIKPSIKQSVYAGSFSIAVDVGPGDKDVCFGQAQVDTFPAAALRRVLPSEVSCRMVTPEREGNLFTGIRRCSGRVGNTVYEIEQPYEAVLRQDSFDVSGTVQVTVTQHSSYGESRSADLIRESNFRVSGKRLGDC